MKMIEIAFLAAGAVIGAFLRYVIVASPQNISGLPINVLIVNIVGSFVLGLFSVISITLNIDTKFILLIATGFCGSFTTMSSFALETNTLINNNSFGLATLNVLTNVGLSLIAIVSGRVLGGFVTEKVL